MNPHNETMQLPAPVEQSPAEQAVEAPNKAEQAPSSMESAASTPALPPVLLPSLAADQPQFTMPSDHGVPAAASSANPAQADDNDLIEKEWVDGAKRIVESTRDDPYKQSEELTVLKADYMKKRYNKTIKLNK